jgi:hypothetical protein
MNSTKDHYDIAKIYVLIYWFFGCLMTVSQLHIYIASKGRFAVNNELGGMVRKAVVTDFKEIFQHFP